MMPLCKRRGKYWPSTSNRLPPTQTSPVVGYVVLVTQDEKQLQNFLSCNVAEPFFLQEVCRLNLQLDLQLLKPVKSSSCLQASFCGSQIFLSKSLSLTLCEKSNSLPLSKRGASPG